MPDHRAPADTPGNEWDRRLTYRRLALDPSLRAGLDRFWQRQFQRELARQGGPDAPGQETPDPALADLPDDLARQALAEGGDHEAVGRARREQAGRPIRATVVTGVYRGKAAVYDQRTDEAVVVDDRPPAATELERTGNAWLSSPSASGGAAPEMPAPAADLSAVTLPRDRRRPQDGPGLDL
jgi:hypothetical protein